MTIRAYKVLHGPNNCFEFILRESGESHLSLTREDAESIYRCLERIFWEEETNERSRRM